MNPKVSIIVPVYNCEKYISECLNSILNQTYSNIEIVIVNDGSTDRSEEIINEIKDKDARLTYYYQENGGPSDARNHGIDRSTGEYIAFIDSDDTVDRCYIEYLINKMLTSPGVDLVCCGYKDISVYGVTNCTDFNFELPISKHNFIDLVCKGTGGVLWSKLFKRKIIIEHNIKMDKDIFMSEDLIFVLQYAVNCRSYATINEYLYNYNRLNQNSISSKISLDYVENNIAVCKHIERIFCAVGTHKAKIDDVITERIQDLVTTLIEQQGTQFRVFGKKNAIYNVKQILSIPYIENYISRFSAKRIIYIPYMYFLRNRFVNLSVIYGVLLNAARKHRRKVKAGEFIEKEGASVCP
jgi:glycosyltransferase involved in cell wall biosynthesis